MDDHRTENWENALRNNAIAHIKYRKGKSHTPTAKEIKEEIEIIVRKVQIL